MIFKIILKYILAAVITVFLLPFNSYAEGKSFAEWLGELKVEAISLGISQNTLDEAFSQIKPNELVLQLDRNQPEFKLSLNKYLERVVSETRVRKGVENYARYSDLLADITKKYGVQGHFLTSFWGVETDFSRVMGSFSVVEALATLAYDPRRSAFFRKELLDSLYIIDAGHISFKKLEGSWAGAFGGLQFLPSVYKKYATDFNADGKIDIFNNNADLFASGANCLASSGWVAGQSWGREIFLPDNFDESLIGLKVKRKISEWQKLGVKLSNGRELPGSLLLSSVIKPDSSLNRFFLVYNNFRIILKWNRSLYYAVAVGLLADQIHNSAE